MGWLYNQRVLRRATYEEKNEMQRRGQGPFSGDLPRGNWRYREQEGWVRPQRTFTAYAKERRTVRHLYRFLMCGRIRVRDTESLGAFTKPQLRTLVRDWIYHSDWDSAGLTVSIEIYLPDVQIAAAEMRASFPIGRVGRPKGATPFQHDDDRMVGEIAQRLQSGRSPSVRASILAVLPRAAGNGVDESTIRRLTRKYSACFAERS